MARSIKFNSPYYPRRAAWYSPLLNVGASFRRQLLRDRSYLPAMMSIGGLVGGLFVPGLAVYLRGPEIRGKLAMTMCAVLFLVFFLWLGHSLANLAFGLILSIHTTGFVYYCSPMLIHRPLLHRLGFTVLILTVLGFGIYMPVRNVIQNHWFTPIRFNGQVVVVQKNFTPKSVKRGDWIAYSISGRIFNNHGDREIYGNTGLGFGPVLAVAGDEVVFSTNSFLVNGVGHPLLTHMPSSGGFTVAQNQWFIWPGFSIRGAGNESTISSVMLEESAVSENQMIGRPLERWFWRKQKLQ